jgi:hypothetical protein
MTGNKQKAAATIPLSFLFSIFPSPTHLAAMLASRCGGDGCSCWTAARRCTARSCSRNSRSASASQGFRCVGEWPTSPILRHLNLTCLYPHPTSFPLVPAITIIVAQLHSASQHASQPNTHPLWPVTLYGGLIVTPIALLCCSQVFTRTGCRIHITGEAQCT